MQQIIPHATLVALDSRGKVLPSKVQLKTRGVAMMKLPVITLLAFMLIPVFGIGVVLVYGLGVLCYRLITKEG